MKNTRWVPRKECPYCFIVEIFRIWNMSLPAHSGSHSRNCGLCDRLWNVLTVRGWAGLTDRGIQHSKPEYISVVFCEQVNCSGLVSCRDVAIEAMEMVSWWSQRTRLINLLLGAGHSYYWIYARRLGRSGETFTVWFKMVASCCGLVCEENGGFQAVHLLLEREKLHHVQVSKTLSSSSSTKPSVPTTIEWEPITIYSHMHCNRISEWLSVNNKAKYVAWESAV